MNGDIDKRGKKKEEGRKREKIKGIYGQEVPTECIALCNECDRVLRFLLALLLTLISSIRVFDGRART